MFVIVSVEDKLRILPDQLDRNPADVLIEQIELKYANKVLPDVGLCIAFYDFVHVGEPYVYPGEGGCHQLVQFRLVVFRPFVGEIITGRILSSGPDGVRVTLGFFDDILIPHFLLQQPSSFDSAKNAWVWNYDSESDVFSMDKDEEVRFKVCTLNFVTVTNTVKERRTSVISETRAAPLRPGSDGTSSSSNSNSGSSNGSGSGSGVAGIAETGTRRRSSSSVGLIDNHSLAAHNYRAGAAEGDANNLSGSGSNSNSNSKTQGALVTVAGNVPTPAAMHIVASVQEDGLGLISWWR